MKFISAQELPQNEYKDENGKYHREPCTFSNVNVPVNTTLGFRPLWAIPVTTYKETLASMLLTAPNYPQLLCVFDTDDYVRIDKLQHYNNIMRQEEHKKPTPIATKDTPDHLTEYCLNRKSLTDMPLMISNILEIAKIRNGHIQSIELIMDPLSKTKQPTPKDIIDSITKYVNAIPQIDIEDIALQMQTQGMCNAEIRAQLYNLWTSYKYTILPILLYAICNDTKDYSTPKGEIKLSMLPLESCANNISQLINLNNEITEWSYYDCTKEGFERIWQACINLIIDSEPVLENLFFNTV